jgi:hypothetical protein
MVDTMDEVLTRDAASGAARAVGGPAQQRDALQALLVGMRSALQGVATARRAAVRRRRGLLQRRLLLGLELLCKLEEQVLFPALGDAVDDAAPTGAGNDAAQTLATLRREIELLRDLSMLVSRTAAANRDTVVGVLEGIAELHGERVDALVAGMPAAGVPWGALEREMRSLLGRWRDEVLTEGDIEDEDRDPVGLPPR